MSRTLAIAGITITGLLSAIIATIGITWTILAVMALFIAFAGALIANQESILYIPVVSGYKRVSDNPEGYRSPADWDAEYREFFVKTSDGERIHGWYIHRQPMPGSSRPVILFCHENAGNIGLRVHNLVGMSNQLGLDVVAFDYRGYGDSSGQPSEEGLFRDTEAVFEYMHTELHAKNIIVYGRSLGGAVALQFAARLGIDESSERSGLLSAVIVENTFTSIADMVGSVFPFLNFKFIKTRCLRLKWESAEWIRMLKVPLLLLSGLKDEIVPASHMMELKAICDRHHVDAEMVTFPEGTHNDTWIVGGKKYWNAIRGFVDKRIT